MYKFLLILLIFGCDQAIPNSSNLEKYRCTKEEIELVGIEFEICNKSGFTSAFCFQQAKKSQCTKIEIAP